MNDYLINKKLSSSEFMDYILPSNCVRSEKRYDGTWRICGINMSTRKYLCAQMNSSCSPLFETPRMIYRDKISEGTEFFILPKYRGRYITNSSIIVEESDFKSFTMGLEIDW